MAKILIVEDSDEFMTLLSATLAGEHEIIMATSWSRALKHIFHVDLILLDIMMAGMQGDKAVKILAEESQKLPKIVFVSSIEEAELRQKAKTLGVLGYITKPIINIELFRKQIRKFLAQTV